MKYVNSNIFFLRDSLVLCPVEPTATPVKIAL